MTDSAEYVAERLGGLGPAWRVVQAVPLGDLGPRMDHLLIGPGGVFALHTEPTDVRATRLTARRVAHLLSDACGHCVEVAPLAVFVHSDPPGTQPPADVLVCHSRALCALLKNRTPILAPMSISAIHVAARRTATWQARREITPSWQLTKQARIFPQATRSPG
jgi:hypothetical protein